MKSGQEKITQKLKNEIKAKDKEIGEIENELKQAGNQQIPGSRKKKLNATEAFSLRTRLAGLKQEYTAKKEKTKGTK